MPSSVPVAIDIYWADLIDKCCPPVLFLSRRPVITISRMTLGQSEVVLEEIWSGAPCNPSPSRYWSRNARRTHYNGPGDPGESEPFKSNVAQPRAALCVYHVNVSRGFPLRLNV